MVHKTGTDQQECSGERFQNRMDIISWGLRCVVSIPFQEFALNRKVARQSDPEKSGQDRICRKSRNRMETVDGV